MLYGDGCVGSRAFTEFILREENHENSKSRQRLIVMRVEGHQFLFFDVAIATDFPGRFHYNRKQKVSFKDST